MRGRLRDPRPAAIASALVAIGSALLAFGIPFVQAWLAYGFLRVVPPPTPPVCYCPLVVANPLNLPNPYPVIVSNTVAIPVVAALAWWIRLRSRRAPSVPLFSRVGRWGSPLLLGAMAWMAGLLAAGLIVDWLTMVVPVWARYVFLVSVVAVPALVLAVGVSCLLAAVRGLPRKALRASRE